MNENGGLDAHGLQELLRVKLHELAVSKAFGGDAAGGEPSEVECGLALDLSSGRGVALATHLSRKEITGFYINPVGELVLDNNGWHDLKSSSVTAASVFGAAGEVG